MNHNLLDYNFLFQFHYTLQLTVLTYFYHNFNIFKNPDYNKSEQTYHFYYTDEVNWSETSLTWNNKPSSIGTGEVLFESSLTG